MEFKEAMRIWKRMCKAHDDCVNCPMDTKGACKGLIVNYDEHRVESILAKWAAEHPERTIADDFFEKFPNAKKTEADIPMVCAAHCGYIEVCYSAVECKKCWRRPLEEVE